MPSTRRSAVVAVLVLLAGLGIAACGRAQPGTAVYIGKTRYTEARIDKMVEDVRRSAPNRSAGGLRGLVVSTIVLSVLAKQAAEAKSIPVPAPQYNEVAQTTGLPVDSDLARAIAELDAAGGALIEKADRVQPTDKDIREIYAGLLASQQVPDGTPYEEVAAQIRSNGDLPGVLGARKLLLEQAEKTGLEVNPRYRPLTANIGSVGVPMVLADGIGVVAEPDA